MNPIIHSIRHNRIPGQLVVQITDRCNARCPQCGMRTTATFRRSTLSTDTIRRLIDAAADRGVQAISFTGGEPLLDLPRLTALINHAGAAGIPFIRTGTNGFIFQHADRSDFTDRIKRIVDQLAATPLRNFWISLDSSVDALHEEMRGFPGVVAGIEKALPIFHAAGIYPAVNLGINRNVGGASTRELTPAGSSSDAAYLETFYHCYQDAFERFYQRAIDLGFTMANACYPMSIDVPESENGLAAVYAATTVADIVRFAPAEKRMLFSALMVAIRRFRARIRIFSPLCALEALVRQYGTEASPPPYGCRGGVDFFFVNAADGHAYPCGYRGNEDHGWVWDMDWPSHRPPAEADACRRCDWECFRDPCELMGPLLAAFAHPLGLARRVLRSPRAMATWATDLFYYRACGFFDGRQAPDYRKLTPFGTSSQRRTRGLEGLFNPQFNQKLSVS
ncbi:hypothetical protein JCM12296A_17680 [Desulfosarcina cetonica]